jgi:hypothetical protein
MIRIGGCRIEAGIRFASILAKTISIVTGVVVATAIPGAGCRSGTRR